LLVEEVISLMEGRAESKRIELEREFGGSIPAIVKSDPTRIRQILINLVANAIKFARNGRVRLILDYLSASHNPTLDFRVVDTGIGMDAHQIDRLFEPFTQADSSTTRE
jgi:signal transduction histidine kinase